MGKENEPCDHIYDVTGSLCENNDKFAIDRPLPKIDMGDYLVIHDTGAHGFAMGYNYNGKLKSAEILLKEDGSAPAYPPRGDAKGLFRHLRLLRYHQKSGINTKLLRTGLSKGPVLFALQETPCYVKNNGQIAGIVYWVLTENL